jgi:exodeoxyribonuclease-5
MLDLSLYTLIGKLNAENQQKLKMYCLDLLANVQLADSVTPTELPSPVVENSFCSLCNRPTLSSPSGFTCSNGHGGDNQFELTSDQGAAWAKLQTWLKTDHSVFVLRGYAGTGKSFLMKLLLTLPHNFVFSAPTNKASQVLAEFIGQQVKTTYSVLGLRMTAEDDKMVLTQATKLPDLGESPILVIDEAGMINSELAKLLRNACADYGWRIIFVGDPAQLNPVGEARSPVWRLAHPEHRAMLREVKRFDNELLQLSIKLRDLVKTPSSNFRIKNDNSNDEGVFVIRRNAFEDRLKSLKNDEWSANKVVVWRNRTAAYYNALVRKALGFKNDYEVGERILLAAPLISGETILGYTDEEFVVEAVDSRVFSLPEGSLETYALSVVGKSFSLYVPTRPEAFEAILNKRASIASNASGFARKKAWKSFWELKSTFQSIRYGYAMTAHRLQGSTYTNVFVDKTDILANPDLRESYRCLYVGATRPTKSLITF